MELLIVGKLAEDPELINILGQQPGAICYHAISGAEALDNLSAHPGIHVIIIDSDLPGTGAFPLIRYIRIKYAGAIHIFLISTFSLPAMYLAWMTGCNEILAKPLNPGIASALLAHYTSENKPKTIFP